MRVYVLHNDSGDVLSIARIEEESDSSSDTFVPLLPVEGQTVTEIPAEGIAVELNLVGIHENYRFDRERGELVHKQSGGDAG